MGRRIGMISLFACWVGLGLPASAIAAGGDGHSHAASIGAPGVRGAVDRTVEIVMTDIRFDVASLRVRRGETIRFVLRNEGKLVHEFDIGTLHMHEEHKAQMLEMTRSGTLTPTTVHEGGEHMSHDHPNSVLLEPGDSAELIWRFEEAIDDLEFACNVPGHYEAGMHGDIEFQS